MTGSLTAHFLAPVANDEDARATARAIDAYDPDHVTAVYVIERTSGAPNVLSPEQAAEHGTEALSAFREILPAAETEVVAAEDVVNGVLEVAGTVDASAIAFQPRGGSRLVQFLSGDTALKLITEADRPVIALPTDDSEGTQAASDESVSEQATSDESVSEQATSDESVSEQAKSDESVSEQATSDESVSEQAKSDESVSEQATSDESEEEPAESDGKASDRT